MNKKRCPFCTKPLAKKNSREHIISKWLLKYLQIADVKISPTHTSSKDNSIVSKRKHVLINLVSGGICVDCNNGWMSSLETENMGTLKGLMSGSLCLADLNLNQKYILARWAFKTALVLNYGSNYHKNIPLEHFQHLFEHQDSLPTRVCVTAHQHQSKGSFDWIQGLPWVCEGNKRQFNKEKTSQLLAKGWKIGFQFGELFLITAYNPFPDCLFLLWRSVLMPLYPSSGTVGWFEREQSFQEENWKILTELGMGVQLLHKGEN